MELKTKASKIQMVQRTNIMRISRPYDGIYRLSHKLQDELSLLQLWR